MNFDSSRDYIVATVLPWMRQKHETKLEQIREFTAEEARQMYMDGLPLIMNHHDGQYDPATNTQNELHVIGEVHASTVHGTDTKVLASIEPTMNEMAMMSSNRVATGLYRGVSLGQQIETRIKASDGYAVFVKRPEEVSLCKEGRREGSLIELYCPGQATIERLALHAPEDLELLIDHHGYRQELIDKGIVEKSSRQYIDALAEISHKRLKRAISANQLHPRPPPTSRISGLMSGSLKDQASTEASQASPATDKEMASSSSPPPPSSSSSQKTTEADAADSSSERSGVTTASIPDVASLKEMTEAALRYKTESVDRAKQLAQMQERLTKAEAAEKKLEEIEQAKRDKIKREFETAIKSLEQFSAVAKFPRETLECTVDSAKDMFEANPERSLGMIKSALTMAARASTATREAEEAQAKKLEAAAHVFDERYFDTVKRRFLDLDEQEVSFSSSYPSRSETAFERRFQEATAAAATTTSSESASPLTQSNNVDNAAEMSTGDNNQFRAKKRSATEMFGGSDTPPAPMFLRASNASEENTFDAATCFADLFQATGVLPTYTQVALGEAIVASGKDKASADGRTREPIMVRKRTRRVPAAIEPANFAPEWDKVLQRAMETGSFRQRFATPNARLRMTSNSVKDIEVPLDTPY